MHVLLDIVLGIVFGVAVAALVVAMARRPLRQEARASAGFVASKAPGSAPTRPAPAAAPPADLDPPAPPGSGKLPLYTPDQLPRFADIGGMEATKQELRDTLGLVLGDPEGAQEYGITWNGILLHGPPGVGKSLLARATAGEFGLSFLPVATADLVSEYAGEGPRLVKRVFAEAAAHLPALLFFDELDSVGAARGHGTNASPAPGATELLTQLLQSLETARSQPQLVVMAATNDLDAIDPAVVRPGRFDRQLRLDLPDSAGRRAVFTAALAGRPVAADLDLDALALRTAGLTPAAIRQAVDMAAMAAMRERAGHGRHRLVRIDNDHLLAAVEQRGGQDRPTVEEWTWERLALPPDVLAELQEVQAAVEDPDRSRRFGVAPPTGILLAGPPGTGKTTVAKVLAAQAKCSFYPVSCADLTSRWVGESERLVHRLFARAREHAPAIVFIDEIDSIGAARGTLSTYDRQLDQLLQEMDGMGSGPGVLVVGATNRPDAIDPALRRGGRLSRTIELGLPDQAGRLAILRLVAAHMPVQQGDLETVAAETDGYSGADLQGLLQQAALEAMMRLRAAGEPDGGDHAVITADDFEHALAASPKKRRRPLRARDEGRPR